MSDATAARGVQFSASAVLPRFDPLAPSDEDRKLRRIGVVSILVHLVLLFVFWDAILGAVDDLEDTVTVQMFDEPEPELPKPKLIQQRQLDTSVTRFQELLQPEITQIRPELQHQFDLKEVQPLELSDAPKVIVQRDVQAQRVDAFADVVRPVTPVRVDTTAPRVHRVQTARASSGPKRLQAAGPVVSTDAVKVEAPTLARGVVSRTTVQGAEDGARIRALESGVGDRHFRGDGDRGALGAEERNCMEDPVCREYLRMIRDRVYKRWTIPPDTTAGRVVLGFRIDRGGSAHGISVRSADDSALGNTCEAAFRHASPFPPPPAEIAYLINKGIRATFTYGN
jgi:hypothetical protein